MKTMKLRLSTVTKLKLISLCMGMMFWYGIEQLFMDKVLQDQSARAWATAVFTGTWLIFDIPGGIIADKFGRRRTLILSSILQTLGVVVLASSTTLPIYLFGAMLYGLHWSTFSGVVQALTYDHLLDQGTAHEYPKHQGSVTAYGYIGATIANVMSGVIADHSTLRMPFIVSIIPSVIGLVLTISLKEPNKKSAPKKSDNQIRAYATVLYKTIRRSPIAAIYAFQIICGLFVFMTICEFGQIFILSYGVSATTLGIIWAVDAVVVAASLHYAHKLQRWPLQSIGLYAVVLVIFGLMTHPLAIALFMLVYAGTEIMHNIAETELQHVTESGSRATVLSSVTFIGNASAIPLVWIFNSLMLKHSIHFANQSIAIFTALLVGISVLVLYIVRKMK